AARTAGSPRPPNRPPPGRQPARHSATHTQASPQRVRRTHRGTGMTGPGETQVLYVIVCGAGPAGEAGRLVELAQDRGWTVEIIATPSALAFIDVPKLEAQTGRPVRSEYRSRGEPKSPRADAIIVAPATYNTINKWANGISDTYALGILAE